METASNTHRERRELYYNWAWQFEEGLVYDELQTQDPKLLALVKMEDADLSFLRGLTDPKEQVVRLSQYVLAQLKTDYSFEALKMLLHGKDARLRYRAMEVIANFRQPRCVQPLLNALGGDSDLRIRAAAALHLEKFPEDKVRTALLTAVRAGPRVAQAAAFALGGLQVEDAIEPTYGLAISDVKNLDHRYVLRALGWHRNKKAVALLVDLLARVSKGAVADQQSGTEESCGH